MKNNTTVCIPIETSVRELDGKLLVAAHLIENNKCNPAFPPLEVKI